MLESIQIVKFMNDVAKIFSSWHNIWIHLLQSTLMQYKVYMMELTDCKMILMRYRQHRRYNIDILCTNVQCLHNFKHVGYRRYRRKVMTVLVFDMGEIISIQYRRYRGFNGFLLALDG